MGPSGYPAEFRRRVLDLLSDGRGDRPLAQILPDGPGGVGLITQKLIRPGACPAAAYAGNLDLFDQRDQHGCVIGLPW